MSKLIGTPPPPGSLLVDQERARLRKEWDDLKIPKPDADSAMVALHRVIDLAVKRQAAEMGMTPEQWWDRYEMTAVEIHNGGVVHMSVRPRVGVEVSNPPASG